MMPKIFETLGKFTPEEGSAVWLWSFGIFGPLCLLAGAMFLGTWTGAFNFFMAGFCAQAFYTNLMERLFQKHHKEMERINAEFAEVAKSMEEASKMISESVGESIAKALSNSDNTKAPSMH